MLAACERPRARTGVARDGGSSEAGVVIPLPQSGPLPTPTQALVVSINSDLSGGCLATLTTATLQRRGVTAWNALEEADLHLYASMDSVIGRPRALLQGNLYREGEPLLPDLYFARPTTQSRPTTQDVEALVADLLEAAPIHNFLARGGRTVQKPSVPEISASTIAAACPL